MSESVNVLFHSKVQSIRERFKRVWTGGTGNDAKFIEESLGWFIGLDGSHESLFIGREKPDVEVGQLVTVRITVHGRQ